MGNEVVVYYSDGIEMAYPSIADAESAITDAVIGSGFAVTVDAVESKKWPNMSVSYSVKIEIE